MRKNPYLKPRQLSTLMLKTFNNTPFIWYYYCNYNMAALSSFYDMYHTVMDYVVQLKMVPHSICRTFELVRTVPYKFTKMDDVTAWVFPGRRTRHASKHTVPREHDRTHASMLTTDTLPTWLTHTADDIWFFEPWCVCWSIQKNRNSAGDKKPNINTWLIWPLNHIIILTALSILFWNTQ